MTDAPPLHPGLPVYVTLPHDLSYSTRVVQVNRGNVWIENGSYPPLAVAREWCACVALRRRG